MASWIDSVRQLRIVGALEGMSFLILLGIAMPLKYAFRMPLGVRVVGMAHGLLFVAYLLVLTRAAREAELPFRLTAGAFLASLVPFGFVVLDRRLRPFEGREGTTSEGPTPLSAKREGDS